MYKGVHININLIWQVCLLEMPEQESKTYTCTRVGQIGVKNNYSTAFCDEDLKFGTVTEEATKSKIGYKVKYYRP